MKATKNKINYAVLLITLVCFSFCSYVLLSPFKNLYEVSISSMSEDTSKVEEHSSKDLIAILIVNDYPLDFHAKLSKKEISNEQVKLPAFDAVPNTPPPNWA